MIENLRKYTGIIIFVVALLFIGMAFVGDNASLMGGANRNDPPVISVDGRRYPMSEVNKLASAPMALVMSRDLGMSGMLDFIGLLGGFGAGDDATQRFFVNRLTIRQAAHDFGVHPSKDEIATEVKQLPIFQNPDGSYNQQGYNDFIAKRIGRLGLTEQDFLEIIRDVLVTRKLADIIGGGLGVDREVAVRQVLSRDQQVSIQLSRLSLAKFKEELQPTDEDLQTEWETTKDRYLTDRRVKVTYVLAKPVYPELPKDEVKLPDAVTEEQKKEAEKAAADKKAADEAKLAEDKRKVDDDLINNVDQLLQDLTNEEKPDLAKLAETYGWQTVTTDFFTRSSLPAELDLSTRSSTAPRPIGDFIFQIAPTDDPMSRFTEALPLQDGAFLLVHLDEVEEARTKTFEEAKEQVRTDYIEHKAGEALKKSADETAAKIRESIAAGKSYADAAKEAGLESKAVGPFKAGQPVDGEADSATLFETAILTAPGALADPVMRPDGALFVFVEKREIVKDEAREDRITQTLSGLDSSEKRIAFMAWLDEKLAASQVESLQK